jgi:hypothetical protein
MAVAAAAAEAVVEIYRPSLKETGVPRMVQAVAAAVGQVRAATGAKVAAVAELLSVSFCPVLPLLLKQRLS